MVLEDDTYKGQIKIGFKFIAKVIKIGPFFFVRGIINYQNSNQQLVFVAGRKVCDGKTRILW